jgi:hypothetical protein
MVHFEKEGSDYPRIGLMWKARKSTKVERGGLRKTKKTSYMGTTLEDGTGEAWAIVGSIACLD